MITENEMSSKTGVDLFASDILIMTIVTECDGLLTPTKHDSEKCQDTDSDWD